MKNSYLKLFILVFSFFIINANASTHQYSFTNIVFFGDSLTDNGNLYAVDLGYLPKSPPYYHGRLSNGPVWSEYITGELSQNQSITSENYAVAGETTLFHNPVDGFLPYTLSASLDSYLLHTIFSDRSNTLFIIWIGSNDYLSGADDVKKLTNNVVAQIQSTIESLIYHGGKNFLLINLPDFALTPYGLASDIKTTLHNLSIDHNAKLEAAVLDIQNNYKSVNIKIFDLNQFFVDFIMHPDVYNQKYKLHIANTTTACWQGGYTLRNNFKQVNLMHDLQNDLLKQSKIKLSHTLNSSKIDNLAKYIATSPDLREAYFIGILAENGVEPCDKPDEFIFWDHIHPTAVVHKVLGLEIANFIGKY
ncbi:MAG: hypothetical protein A3F12_06820 [Gammaproteobacteria bacterium RIFCSPHIGHO2_12_FULL_38_14]|nr:MAG: hypothetical protein A3F12_06820 [Gammaproteobacteria bacterium RIFCSPHIGHO2_12_FULL_38_14]